MSKKNLLIITALLVAIAVFVQLYSQKSRRQGDTPVGNPLASVNLVESIDEIVINGSKKAIHLKKQDEQWVVTERGDFPVDSGKLVQLLDNLTSFRIASLITKNQSRFADFSVQESSTKDSGSAAGGTRLQLKSGGTTAFQMIAGKSRDSVSKDPNRPSRPDGTYVRIGNTPAVYLIKENLSFDSDPDEWIQKVIMRIDRDTVQSIRFENQASRFDIERADAKSDLLPAGLAKEENADKQALDDLLDELNEFKINTANPRGSNLEKRVRLQSEITVSLFDNSILKFQILTKTDKNPLAKEEADKTEITYFAKLVEVNSSTNSDAWRQLKTLGDNWLFEVDEWQAKNWLKSRKEFIKSAEK